MREAARVRGVAGAIAIALLAAAGCAAHESGPPAVKANGCTATVSGHTAGRPVVTYSDTTHDPKVQAALAQAAAQWNSSGVRLLLHNATSSGSIAFVPTTGLTHTTPCTAKAPRAVTVYLNSKAIASGGTTNDPLPHLLARELGHALGLGKAGRCGALMTAACKQIPPGPDAAEVAEINRLYAHA